MEAQAQQRPSIGKIATKYGLIQGVVGFLLFVVVAMTGMTQSWLTTSISIIVLVVLVVLAHREFKKANEGIMSYGQGVGLGTLLTVIASVLSCILAVHLCGLHQHRIPRRRAEGSTGGTRGSGDDRRAARSSHVDDECHAHAHGHPHQFADQRSDRGFHRCAGRVGLHEVQRPQGRDLTRASGVREGPGILYGTAWKKLRTEALVSQAIAEWLSRHRYGLPTQALQRSGCRCRRCGERAFWAAARRAVSANEVHACRRARSPKQIPYDPDAPLAEQVAQSIEVSLSNLQTHYVDCLVLHSPLREPAKTRKWSWQAMRGRVSLQGRSNSLASVTATTWPCWSACIAGRASNLPSSQNRFYADTGYDIDIRAFCRQHGITYQSFWTPTANPHVLEHEQTGGWRRSIT